MNALLVPMGVMAALGLCLSVLLALAHRLLRVEEDVRIDAVEGALPGTNCGACGEPGCRAFAERLVTGQELPGRCTVSTPDEVEAIAHFLGVDAGFTERMVARLHCAGGEGMVRELAEYRGRSSCRAAVLVSGGGRACAWGCLGLGDCERACDVDAIRMSHEHLPIVDPERCTACNDCVEICPLDLFTLEPAAEKLLVQCASPMTGDAARALCEVACDGCARCVVDAPPGALEMRDGLPWIIESGRAGREATRRCPTGAIQWVEGRQFAP